MSIVIASPAHLKLLYFKRSGSRLRPLATSRRDFRVRVLLKTCLPWQRARGMPGAGRTHGPPAEKSAGGRYHRFSRDIPAFPARMVGTAASRSPRCAGLSGHRVRMMLSHQRGYQRRGIRTTRLDRAHQCCSSARTSHAATSTRPPHPASTFVTTAKRPSYRDGTATINHNF
jgi:hypothetical protein